MEKIGFTGRAQHAVIHQQLLGRLAQFHQEFRASGTFTDACFHFLKLWLRAHICGIDTKYAAHARAV